jgi:hypothetical protein
MAKPWQVEMGWEWKGVNDSLNHVRISNQLICFSLALMTHLG